MVPMLSEQMPCLQHQKPLGRMLHCLGAGVCCPEAEAPLRHLHRAAEQPLCRLEGEPPAGSLALGGYLQTAASLFPSKVLQESSMPVTAQVSA